MNCPDIWHLIRTTVPVIRMNPRKNIKPKDIVMGAIIGDIIGSKYEFTDHNYVKSQYEELPPKRAFFTDDTVLSIATMAAVLEEPNRPNYRKHYIDAYKKYPRAGYGASFVDWALNEINNSKGYNSMANGAAMRLSFIPAYYEKLDDVMLQTAKSTMVTHNHVEAVKCSLILSVCIWMALHNYSKEDIKSYCTYQFTYTPEEQSKLYYGFTMFDWNQPLDELSNAMTRQTLYANNAVPFAIKCFLETESYEDCMREILSHYGDTDTICAIAGPLCVAYYGETGFDNLKILKDAQVDKISIIALSQEEIEDITRRLISKAFNQEKIFSEYAPCSNLIRNIMKNIPRDLLTNMIEWLHDNPISEVKVNEISVNDIIYKYNTTFLEAILFMIEWKESGYKENFEEEYFTE